MSPTYPRTSHFPGDDYDRFERSLSSAPSVNEQVKQRVSRELLARGIKPESSEFHRRLDREMQRQSQDDRRKRRHP